MSVTLILAIIALVLAVIDEFRAQGQSLTGWAVVLLSICVILMVR